MTPRSILDKRPESRLPGLPRRLTQARLARGFTQVQLALAAGTTQAVVQKIENGASRLPRMLTEIAQVLDVPVEWLLYGLVGEPVEVEDALQVGFTERE